MSKQEKLLPKPPNTPFGRKIVEVQVAYIKMLTSGEIDL